VAANLRYYAAEEGKPVVAQRLKKFPTIAGKLLREPGMKLSRMADIGGVRARHRLLSADSLETIKQTHSSYFSHGSTHLQELLQS
jgi:hypothetical protein